MAGYLSQDPMMLHEIREGIDQHAATCTGMMEMELTKDNRTDAKLFNFRAIYANPETSWYGYFMDNKMPNFSKDKWKDIVKGFFEKYAGLATWHQQIIDEVRKTGMYKGPTGRIWKFNKYPQKGGYLDYDVGQIRNYMVQGTSGDIIKLAMVVANKKRLATGLIESKQVITVHDSYIWDTPEHEAKELAKIIIEVFREIPELCQKYFGFRINCPITGEADLGLSWGDMKGLNI